MVNVIKFKCILKNCKLIYKFPFKVWARSFQIGNLIKLLPIDVVSLYLECTVVFNHFLEISRGALYISEGRNVVHVLSSVKLPYPGNLDSDQLLCFQKGKWPPFCSCALSFSRLFVCGVLPALPFASYSWTLYLCCR